MTDLVKSLKIGNNSYSIQDANTLSALTASQRTTLLSDGTYLGNTVESGRIFETDSGKFEQFVDDAQDTWAYSTGNNSYYGDALVYTGQAYLGANGSNSLSNLRRSTNGIKWTSVSVPVSNRWNYGSASDGNGVVIFRAGNTTTNAYIRSEDHGLTWESKTLPASWSPRDGATSCANGVFFTARNKDYFYSTDKALTWTQASFPTNYMTDVVYVAPNYFALGQNSNNLGVGIYKSTSPEGPWTLCVSTTATTLTASDTTIAALSTYQQYVCVYSNDKGLTWSTSSLPLSESIKKILYANGVFFGYSYASNKFVYSKDAVTWQTGSTGSSAINSSVAGSDCFVGARNSVSIKSVYGVTHDYSLTPLSYSKSETDTALAVKIGEDSIGNGLSFEEGSLSIVQASNPVWEQPQVNEPGTMGVSDIAVTESGYYEYTGYDLRAYQCFNDGAVLGKDHWQKNEVSTSTYEWVSWYTKTPVNVKNIVVRNSEGAFSPSNYILEGSNDNSSWTTLTSGTNTNVTNFEDWTISSQNNNAYYNYYRLKVLPRTSVAIMIGKLFITGYEYTGTGTVAKATNTLYGLVKPDGTSITVDDGVLSATGGTTYTAGTGIDITGGIISNTGLVNTATGNNSLTLLGTPTTKAESVNIGKNSNLESGGNRNVAIGYNSVVQTGAAYATAMGWYAWTQHDGSIALGAGCKTGKINSFYVAVGGFNAVSYMMMDSSGHIPVERYYPMTGANGTNAGKLGAVPAPAATDNNKFLRGDGTWAEAGSSLTAGSNITIDNGIISSKDTTYMAGTGISITGPTEYVASADKIGSVVISDGKFTPSSSNYLRLTSSSISGYSGSLFTNSYNWAWTIKFKSPADLTKQYRIFTLGSATDAFYMWCSITEGTDPAGFVHAGIHTKNGWIDLSHTPASSGTILQPSTWYWLRISRDVTQNQYKLELSTDGTNWTVEATTNSSYALYSTNTNMYLSQVNSSYLPLEYDLSGCSFTSNYSTGINWVAYEPMQRINSTGLVNTATGSGSVGILANPSAYSNSVIIGSGARNNGHRNTVIGQNAYTVSGTSDSVVIGKDAYISPATINSYSIALGTGAVVTASQGIQIGYGTNSTNGTMKVSFGKPGVTDPKNYVLLKDDGNIPAERLSSIYEVVQALPASPTAGKIYFVLGA